MTQPSRANRAVSPKRHGVGRTLRIGGVLAIVLGLGGAEATLAGYSAETYGELRLQTESPMAVPPVSYDQSAGSALFISDDGELFVSGFRGTGDGNGSVPEITADPTRVLFPEGVEIVDAAGSTNDFSTTQRQWTSFMALDSAGRVYTWGTPYNSTTYLGRGPVNATHARTAGQVTRTDQGEALPPILQISRSENQFLAIDGEGIIWAWGYGNENMPLGNSTRQPLFPTRVGHTTLDPGENGVCAGTPRDLGVPRWHSLWGGNNSSGAVGQNGLIYTWGFDNSNGLTSSRHQSRCPSLNEGANRALFQAYPDLYRDAAGSPYDEAVLGTEAERRKQYLAIVNHLRPRILPACGGVKVTGAVDESACPVRQLQHSARAPRLLLQNGELYTWQVSTENYGPAFLGRTPTEAEPAFRPARVRVEGRGDQIRQVAPGVSAVTALTNDGRLFGWGQNNYCQAVGATTRDGQLSGEDCAVMHTNGAVVAARLVRLPIPVQGIPAGVVIAEIASTQCATFAVTDDLRVFAWGGGTIEGVNYRSCTADVDGGGGYKIWGMNSALAEHPFGLPVTERTTGTRVIRGNEFACVTPGCGPDVGEDG